MGDSQDFPTDRATGSTTSAMVDLIAALDLPSLGTFASDLELMDALPVFPDPPDSFASSDIGSPQSPQIASQLGVARKLMDDCVAAVARLKKYQNQCAGLAAALMERLDSSVAVEGTLLSFDGWQTKYSLASMEAELAIVLQIPQSATNQLMSHATILVRERPATMQQLHDGELAWEHAVVIADEVTLLQESGVSPSTIAAFELLLLEKASGATLPSFRDKVRRLRERQFPESIVPRTRRAYADRKLTKSRDNDGMSWLGIYAPAPAVEAVWDQCTATAQASQGPHEPRTLSQLRVDIAVAMLLNQTLAENQTFAPPHAAAASTPPTTMSSQCPSGKASNAHTPTWESVNPAPTVSEQDSEYSDAASCSYGDGPAFDQSNVPVFDDQDYNDPLFREPDIRNSPDWVPNARPPDLRPAAGTNTPVADSGGSVRSPRLMDDGTSVWPPLPKIQPIVLLPALSLIGLSDDPAWMEGVGPISIEVAKQMMSESSSFYRVLVDPVTQEVLNSAPDRYRVSKAMRDYLRIRDEYCQFPGCMSKASTAQIDHIRSFESGGATTTDNLEMLCLHHHLLKHFRDDKTRSGRHRDDQSSERRRVGLRGWIPRMTAAGRVSWTSPTGHYYPAAETDPCLSRYPGWLKQLIDSRIDGSSIPLVEDQESPDALCHCDEVSTLNLLRNWPDRAEAEHLIQEALSQNPQVFDPWEPDVFVESQLLNQSASHALEHPNLGQNDRA